MSEKFYILQTDPENNKLELEFINAKDIHEAQVKKQWYVWEEGNIEILTEKMIKKLVEYLEYFGIINKQKEETNE